jgi:predicted RNA-binding protein with PUA-like domain
MPHAYWLLKTEPSTYSFETLLREGSTNWDQIRNYQARNFLREIRKGDLALIYHSGDEKAVVGIAEITREAYPDPDPDGGDWVQVDLKKVQRLSRPVPLAELKAEPRLKNLLLIKQSRLSAMPVTQAEYECIVSLASKSMASNSLASKPQTSQAAQPRKARP